MFAIVHQTPRDYSVISHEWLGLTTAPDQRNNWILTPASYSVAMCAAMWSVSRPSVRPSSCLRLFCHHPSFVTESLHTNIAHFRFRWHSYYQKESEWPPFVLRFGSPADPIPKWFLTFFLTRQWLDKLRNKTGSAFLFRTMPSVYFRILLDTRHHQDFRRSGSCETLLVTQFLKNIKVYF